jgi:hypothetical protein
MILITLLIVLLLLLTRSQRMHMMGNNNALIFILCLLPFLAIGTIAALYEFIFELQLIYDFVTFGG